MISIYRLSLWMCIYTVLQYHIIIIPKCWPYLLINWFAFICKLINYTSDYLRIKKRETLREINFGE